MAFEDVSKDRAQRMTDRILKIEARNIKTNRSTNDRDMVKKIKEIIREEAEAK